MRPVYFVEIKVKEVGLSVEDCSCLAQDAFRIFGVYWSIGDANNGSLPPYWPARLSALSSSQDPLHLKFNGVPAQVYLSVSSKLLYKQRDVLKNCLYILNEFVFLNGLPCFLKGNTDILLDLLFI